MRCVLVLAGSPVPRDCHPNLAAATAWGAEVRWTGDVDRASVDRALPEVCLLTAQASAMAVALLTSLEVDPAAGRCSPC